MLNNLNTNKTETVTIKPYIPELYHDQIGLTENLKDIDDSINSGVYRFYGLFLEANQQVGYIKYHIPLESLTLEIERIKIDLNYRRKGYGTLLLRESIIDILKDYPKLKAINVCSTAEAIPFYQKNSFTPYFGENNLTRKI